MNFDILSQLFPYEFGAQAGNARAAGQRRAGMYGVDPRMAAQGAQGNFDQQNFDFAQQLHQQRIQQYAQALQSLMHLGMMAHGAGLFGGGAQQEPAAGAFPGLPPAYSSLPVQSFPKQGAQQGPGPGAGAPMVPPSPRSPFQMQTLPYVSQGVGEHPLMSLPYDLSAYGVR